MMMLNEWYSYGEDEDRSKTTITTIIISLILCTCLIIVLYFRCGDENDLSEDSREKTLWTFADRFEWIRFPIAAHVENQTKNKRIVEYTEDKREKVTTIDMLEEAVDMWKKWHPESLERVALGHPKAGARCNALIGIFESIRPRLVDERSFPLKVNADSYVAVVWSGKERKGSLYIVSRSDSRLSFRCFLHARAGFPRRRDAWNGRGTSSQRRRARSGR